MKPVTFYAWLICLIGSCGLMAGSVVAQDRQAMPPAPEIINKAVERAKWVEAQKFESQYAYTRLTVTEKLDSDGSVKERRERVYHVIPIDGVPYSRLIQKDGKPLSPAELEKEQQRERGVREKLAQHQHQEPDDDDDEIAFNEELVSRYHFETVGQETINGRSAYALTFKPKGNDLPERRRIDRLLNKLAGKIWIDQQEYEIAKVEASLLEGVKMWGGVLASIRRFDLRFEQTRVDEGVWLQSRFSGHIDGRYLFNSLRVNSAEQWSNFRKVAPQVGQVSGGKL